MFANLDLTKVHHSISPNMKLFELLFHKQRKITEAQPLRVLEGTAWRLRSC